jgi:hypothetical protein
MKFIKFLIFIAIIIPSPGYSDKDIPIYESYEPELKIMREILIKNQICSELGYTSWKTNEYVMRKYFEGLDKLTITWDEDVNSGERITSYEYERDGYRETIKSSITAQTCTDIENDLNSGTIFVKHFRW